MQGLIWAVFGLNGLFGYIQLPDFDLQDILLTGCIYISPVFALSLLVSKVVAKKQMDQLLQEINSIKANDDVFRALLAQQQVYEVNKSDSQILFGNTEAQLMISIFTNPFCGPCAGMHKRVDKLLKETKENVCIQYIFSAFNENLEYANRYFNAIYLEKGRAAVWQLYSDWFEKGKALKESFFQ